MWIRIDSATRKVKWVSVPPFTKDVDQSEEDIQIADQPLPENARFLFLNKTADGFDVVIPQAELDERDRAKKRSVEVAKDPGTLTLDQRVKRLEIAMGLEKGLKNAN